MQPEPSLDPPDNYFNQYGAEMYDEPEPPNLYGMPCPRRKCRGYIHAVRVVEIECGNSKAKIIIQCNRCGNTFSVPRSLADELAFLPWRGGR